MKVLVTGARGFLGSELVRQLSLLGNMDINALVREGSDTSGIAGLERVTLIKGDLMQPDTIPKALDGVEVVYHLAAAGSGSHTDLILNTVVGTDNLLKHIQGSSVKRVVLVSSFSVYGLKDVSPGAVVDEDTPVENNLYLRDSYTVSKIRQERISISRCAEMQVQLVIVRPGKIYGPATNPIPPQLGLGIPGVCFLYVGGRSLIPFTHVSNCAEAILLAGIAGGIEGEIFNIVDDLLISQKKFLKMFESEMGRIPRRVWIPLPLFKIMGRVFELAHRITKGNVPPVITRYRIDNMYKYVHYDNSHAKVKLNWSPRVPMESGVQEMIRYYKESVGK